LNEVQPKPRSCVAYASRGLATDSGKPFGLPSLPMVMIMFTYGYKLINQWLLTNKPMVIN